MEAAAEQLQIFTWPVRVYIEDTDAGGIVFYANYLNFMERARTEFIRHLGFPRLETIDPSVQFVVHSLNVNYQAPARLDDKLDVSAQIMRLGRTYMFFEQQVSLDSYLLVGGEVKVACIDKTTFKPCPMPRSLYTVLSQKIK